MNTHTVKVENTLATEEYAEIDRFCSTPARDAGLSDIAQFLKERFSLELTLDPDIINGFTTDSSNLPGHAVALCRPSTTRECAIIFRSCFTAGIPYTISGGKSNLTGSATPEGGVVISTVNMQSPEVTVDQQHMTVLSPAGIILEELRNSVLAQSNHQLIYPVDPTSRTDATVGGTIACNASGFTPGEAGATRPWVMSVDFLLPSGLIIRASRGQYTAVNGLFMLDHEGTVSEVPVPTYHRPGIKNAGGPWSSPTGSMDFIDFVVGSEGIFGMVTACCLKLANRPSDYLDMFFSLPEETEAVCFYDYLRDYLGGTFERLSAFEYFGINSRVYMEHEDVLFSGDNQVGINVQIPLHDQPLEDAAEEWLGILLEADCGIDEDGILLLDNERVRNIFLEARHSMPANALEVVQHRGTFTIMTDTVVPHERFREFLNYARDLITSEGIDYLSFGHMGDCHLHFTLLPEKDQLDQGRNVYDRIVTKSSELGGVYSGEHGTGKRKRQDFFRCYGRSAVEEIKRCKAAVDPEFLLNRGNVIEKD